MTVSASSDCTATSFTLDPQVITVTGLVPGQPEQHEVVVQNLGTDPIEVQARVQNTSGLLFSGATPLQVTTQIDGEAARVVPGSTATVDVNVLLPSDAGAEYQSGTGEATIRVTATAGCSSSGGGDDLLATTGPIGGAAVMLIALVCIAAGALLRRRRRSQQ